MRWTSKPVNLNHFTPQSYWSGHHNNLALPHHARHTPILGPLHLLFLLPELCFPDIHMAQSLISFKPFFK